jgi:hypothetical protein
MNAPSSLVAVELNDAGVTVARAGVDGGATLLGAESPGFALLHDGRVLVGTDALQRHRLSPLHAQNRFWYALGTEPLPWSARGVSTPADLAHAHLSAVLAPAVAAGVHEAVLAVPPGLTREQLGLLVGIANESGVTVRGLVDLGLAACATVAPAPHMLHLDLQLHQAAATLVDLARAEAGLRRTRYELLPGVGLLALRQTLAESIATTFVRETRFDPLHEAATEQRLHDRLPEWLQQLREHDEVEADIEIGALHHGVAISRAQLASAVESLSAEVLRLVQSSRPAGLALHLCVTPRVAAVPGLLDRLTALRDCVVVALEPGAAAIGALQFANAVVRPADAIALVHRLPVQAPTETIAPGEGALQSVVPDAVPTHVLFRGRAWPLSGVPLTLGWSVGGGPRALALPAGIAGVSREHCTLRMLDGQAVVEDRSTYGTFVNDERVGGRAALRVGDVLRLGAPGVTLELIRVLENL